MMKIGALLTTAVLAVSGTAVGTSSYHHRPQPHETRFDVESNLPGDADQQAAEGRTANTPVDPRQYPAGTTFRLRTLTDIASGGHACWTLYDVTVQQSVPGSSVCHRVPGSAAETWYADELPVRFPATCHLYVMQRTNGYRPFSSTMTRATLIARWRE